MKKLINAWLPVILWAGLIFYLSNQPVLPGPDVYILDFLFKKLSHIFVYLILYLLTYRAINIINKQNKSNWQLILPLLICIIYATSDEFHQSLIANRSATLRDVGYDSLGIGIAFLKKYNYI